MKYGVDVAVRRADDLDKSMLSEVISSIARKENPLVLDIGAGAGGQSERLASLGALVTAVDIADYTSEFSAIKEKLNVSDKGGAVTFVQADITKWIKSSLNTFDIISIQRTLHYVPYHEAKLLLENLRALLPKTLYISVTGATSAIAHGYDGLTVPIEERFVTLLPSAQEVFTITAPLCIYYEHELLSLLEVTGWRVTWSRVSDFGNIKVIAVPN